MQKWTRLFSAIRHFHIIIDGQIHDLNEMSFFPFSSHIPLFVTQTCKSSSHRLAPRY